MGLNGLLQGYLCPLYHSSPHFSFVFIAFIPLNSFHRFNVKELFLIPLPSDDTAGCTRVVLPSVNASMWEELLTQERYQIHSQPLIQ
jgi:hypothetical protein